MPENRITAQQFSTISVQAVAFVSDRLVASGKVMAAVLKNYADRYDGDPQALPLPPDMPAEIPRVILKSAEPRYKFEASPTRLASQWMRNDDGEFTLADLTAECGEVIAHCMTELNPHVGRLALVLTRFIHVDDPAQSLVSRFCSADAQAEPFNRSTTFEIHNHKRYQPLGLESTVNSWVRCRTGVVGDDKSPAIVIEQDINTLVEDSATSSFNADDALQFYRASAGEADKIIAKYFPG